MKKHYVLDTNILILDPDSIYKFDEHDLYISPVTLKEINGLKNAEGEAGFMARRVKQNLDELRTQGVSIMEGLPLGEGKGKLRIIHDIDFSDFLPSMSRTTNDDYILAAACYLKHFINEDDVVLVTNDIDLSLLCDLVGLKTEKYRNSAVDEELYAGRRQISVPADVIDDWYTGKYTAISEDELQPNEYILLTDWQNRSALGKYSNGKIVPLYNFNENQHPSDITAKNNGQRFMIDALMDDVDNCPLVIVRGSAGTAKTFISLACGLDLVVNKNKYERVLITRSNVAFDNTYGYLPGTEQEKIGPMMRPFMDNLESLYKTDKTNSYKDGIKLPSIAYDLIENDIIRAESMEYMRGRSICNTFVIIDEAQNTTPTQILSIISRIGAGSKIVLLGDPEQIDNKFLSAKNNGLVFASDRFKGSKLCAQIEFKKSECVRSALAKEAAERLV